MSFGRVKTRLRALINRKDFTDQLAGDFILDAISVIERDVRIGPMETIVEKSDWNGTTNAFPVPTNYLETVNVFTDHGLLDQVSFDEFMAKRDVSGPHPLIYTRVADRFLLCPTPAPDTVVYLHYFGETARPSQDGDETVWTEAGFVPLLYKGAELASDFFQMEPEITGQYAVKYQTAVEAVAGQAVSEAWSGRLAVGAPQDIGDY